MLDGEINVEIYGDCSFFSYFFGGIFSLFGPPF